MVEEEAPASEASVTMADETLVPLSRNMKTEDTQPSIECSIETGTQGGADSSNNNENGNAEDSALTSAGEGERTLEFVVELAEKGSKALKERDYAEAVECFSRALEIKLVSFYLSFFSLFSLKISFLCLRFFLFDFLSLFFYWKFIG